MACARGCCATPGEHYRSVAVAHPRRAQLRRTTTDDHGTHQVRVTQHWHDRQDVTVRPQPLRATLERP